jgi:hypothetical protein
MPTGNGEGMGMENPGERGPSEDVPVLDVGLDPQDGPENRRHHRGHRGRHHRRHHWRGKEEEELLQQVRDLNGEGKGGPWDPDSPAARAAGPEPGLQPPALAAGTANPARNPEPRSQSKVLLP